MPGDLGNIKIAIPYFESRLIFLVGAEINNHYGENQVVLYDDKYRKNIGLISLSKESKILNLSITKFAIFIMLKHKIIVYEVISLKYVCTFEDVCEDPSYSVKVAHNQHSKDHPIILTYISNLNKNHIKIARFIVNEKNELAFISRVVLITNFESVQFINLSYDACLLAAVSEKGNKIALYDINSIQLNMKYCLWRGKAEAQILHMCFSPKNKFLAVLSTNLTFHIYNLQEHEDNRASSLGKYDFSMSENETVDDRSTFFTDFFSNLIVRIF